MKRVGFFLTAFWIFLTYGSFAQSADLTGIAHVALRANDLAKSSAFYKTLGFVQAFSFTDAEKTSVVFLKIDDQQFIELYPRTSVDQPGGLLHICFAASDLASLHGAYLERGLQPTEIRKARAGNLLFVMHDPEGQLLEYTQYLPGSLHSLDHGNHLDQGRIAEHLLKATIPAKNLAAQNAFYQDKLSFSPTANLSELLIAGSTGDKVHFVSPAAAPEISFTVTDLAATAKELRKRGLAVSEGRNSLSITDPDGTIIAFLSLAP